MKINILKSLKIILPFALGIYLIWFFFQNMSEKSLKYFYKAFNEANYFWIVLTLFLSFIAHLFRAYRWKYTLEPLGFKINFWNRYHALMIGYLINLTIPRAGEISRAIMLYRSDGIPFSKSFGTIIAERAIDLMFLFVICLFTLGIAYDDFMEIFQQIKVNFDKQTVSENGKIIKYGIYLFGALGFIISVVLVIFNQKVKQKLLQIVREILDGIFSLLKSKQPFYFFGYTFLIWILYLLYFGIAFLSLEETKNFPIDGVLIAFIAGVLGISFTNGGIGAFPLLISLVIVFYLGKSNSNALAIGNALGFLIWVSQTGFLIILGLISLALLPKNFNKENTK